MAAHRAFIDESILDGIDVPGMRPAHQARSRAPLIDLFNEALVLLRDLGGVQFEQAMPRALALLPIEIVVDGAEDRVRFASQMLFGTLNNLVLINPGPFGLNDPETAQMPASAMVQFIRSTPKRRDGSQITTR